MSAQQTNLHIVLIVRDGAVISRQIRNANDVAGTAEQPEILGDKWIDVTVQTRWLNAGAYSYDDQWDFKLLSATVADVYTCDDVSGEWDNGQYVTSAHGFSMHDDVELMPTEIMFVKTAAVGTDWENDSWV